MLASRDSAFSDKFIADGAGEYDAVRLWFPCLDFAVEGYMEEWETTDPEPAPTI